MEACVGSWGVNEELRRRSFKLETMRLRTFRQVMFLVVVSGGRIAAVELMYDLLSLRRSGGFKLAISDLHIV
jgi:hypothetical protein